jgi:hypothetical protein
MLRPMRIPMTLLSCMAMTLVVCGGCGASSTDGVAPGAAGPSEQPSGGGGGEANEPPRSPPPVLGVRAEPAGFRGFEIVVENRGAESARVKSRVLVEAGGDSGWAIPSGMEPLELRYDSGTPAEDCVTLAPGGAYHAPPWSGRIGKAQCDGCADCTSARPGRYRFVVESCDGHRIDGAPFDL